MKKIIMALCLSVFALPTYATSLSGIMTIDGGYKVDVEIDPINYPGVTIKQYGGGSYFAMGADDPNGNAAMLKPSLDGAGGIVLGSYQNFVLNPDIPGYDSDGPDGPSQPGSGYIGMVQPADILKSFSFFGSPTYVGTNPLSYQNGSANPAPTATVAEDGTLSVDMSSWEVFWNGTAFQQGPRVSAEEGFIPAMGFYDSATGAYSLDWSSLIVGGPFANVVGYWHLEGQIRPTPLPASLWLFMSGIGLLLARSKIYKAR